ncbi:MAG TPA: exo-beta-N-acetylmuramidase NamZ domain-containing protein [Acidobacteriaceae bacterium]|nr:exo-beta-N-acetylmuramidase NamZ domain-containing protein [Acidobacteriaceae bacterium]
MPHLEPKMATQCFPKSQFLRRCTSFLLRGVGGLLLTGALAAQAQRSASPDFSSIDRIMANAVDAHLVPGAVIVVGHNGKVVFHKAYGERSLEPNRAPMTQDTVFDMASMTKILATSTAAMELYQQGKFRLNDPVARYLPEFGANGKEDITIRQIMTHYSGLPPDVDLTQDWWGKQKGLDLAFSSKPDHPPGTRFRYSDINFITVGALVERLSGTTLDAFAAQNIFAPLGMNHTRFLPPDDWRGNIAPTQYDEHHHMLLGVVHDPTARRMGGVAGHAGLFSTAGDVAIYAQSLLDQLQGRPSKFPVNRLTLEKMTTPQQPATGVALRGLGWDIESPFSGNRGELFPVGGFGHTGFTGTDLWIDPWSDSYVIFLSNRVHPNGGKNSVPLEGKIADAAAQALHVQIPDTGKKISRLTGYNESLAGMRRQASRNGVVHTGIDVLEQENFAVLAGLLNKHGGRLRMGVLTNQTGIDSSGRRTIDVLAKEAPAKVPGLTLTTIFSPEHGIFGAKDTTDIASGRDEKTGLPVVSLYGATDAQRHPSAEQMRKLDAVVIDLQDAGVRFYTYETAMAYFLQAAAHSGTDIVVLDRPDPLNGSFVQGPVSDASHQSYTNFMPLPVRHGMTMGELARYFNGEGHLGASLTVVPVQGWQRGDWYDSTSLLWIDPSPNLRNMDEATLYPGVGMIETSNISVGRGTNTPFQWIGAPWIDGPQLAAALNGRFPTGIRFLPVQFTPEAPYPYAGQLCHGVGFLITDRNVFNAPELGLELASMLHKLYPVQFHLGKIETLVANRATMDALQQSEDSQSIAESWDEQLQAFKGKRKAYLLYGGK